MKCHYCDGSILVSWRVTIQAGDETIDYLHCTETCRTATFSEIRQSQLGSEKRAALRAIAQRAADGDTQAALDFIKELTK